MIIKILQSLSQLTITELLIGKNKNPMNIFALIFMYFTFGDQCMANPQRSSFDVWKGEIEVKLKKLGLKEAVIQKFKSSDYDHRLKNFYRRQPEFREKFISYYKKRALPLEKKGFYLRKKYARILEDVYSKFRIPDSIILALWGIETNFGQNMGNFKVLRSLASLAFDSPRKEFFENELIIFLKLANNQHLNNVHNITGSWAGAMGHCQFMPSSFERFAFDMDGDGRKDIWQSLPDAMASIAMYLRNNNWREKQSWIHLKVSPPAAVRRRVKEKQPLKAWALQGVKGIPKNLSDNDEEAKLYKIDSEYYLTHQNFETLLSWNRSLKFALSVAQLAEVYKKS